MSTCLSSVANRKIPIISWYICKSSGSSSGEPTNSGKYYMIICIDTLFDYFHCLDFSPSSTVGMATCTYLTLPIVQHSMLFMSFNVSWIQGTYKDMQYYHPCIVLYFPLGSSVFLWHRLILPGYFPHTLVCIHIILHRLVALLALTRHQGLQRTTWSWFHQASWP